MWLLWMEISILDDQDFVKAIQNGTKKHLNHMHRFQRFPKKIYFLSAYPRFAMIPRFNTYAKPMYTRDSRFSFEAEIWTSNTSI